MKRGRHVPPNPRFLEVHRGFSRNKMTALHARALQLDPIVSCPDLYLRSPSEGRSQGLVTRLWTRMLLFTCGHSSKSYGLYTSVGIVGHMRNSLFSDVDVISL